MTATNATRKARGQRTQNLVAGWFRDHGWPYAESAGAGRTGSDVTGMPGLACEVKARTGFSPLAWIKQARAGGKGLAFVVFRCNGQGEQSIGDWPVLLRLADFTELLIAADYGSCPNCGGSGVCELTSPECTCDPGPEGQHHPYCGTTPCPRGCLIPPERNAASA